MSWLIQHIVRCLVAGIVALLPVAAIIFGVVYIEYSLASFWLAKQGFYFPGLGLLAVVAGIYLIGLVVGTVVGQWMWRLVDKLFGKLPIVGSLYQTMKQILGYGEGPGALFERVVLVPVRETDALEMGLVTNTIQLADGSQQLLVFIPACPNPMAGRLIVIEPDYVQPVEMSVSDAMRALVALGKAGVKNLQPQIAELEQAVSVKKGQTGGRTNDK